MADRETTFRLRFENEDMEKVFQSINRHINETNAELEELEKTQKDAFDSMSKSAKQADEQVRKQGTNLDAAKVKFKELGQNAQDSLEGIGEKGGSATSAISKLGRAGGIAGTVIAGVGVAVVAAFLDVEENAKKAKRELEGLKSVGNELKTRTFAGLRAIIQAGLGNFGAYAKDAAIAFGQGRDSLADIRQQGRDFFDLQNRIAQANQLIVKTEAERAVQLEKLQLLASDENRTTAERINLIRNAASIQNELTGLRISELNNELALIRTENEVYGEQEGSLESIASIEAELIELRGQSQLTNIQTQQQVNALLKEEEEIRNRIIEQIKDASALFSSEQAAQQERQLEKTNTVFQGVKRKYFFCWFTG